MPGQTLVYEVMTSVVTWPNGQSGTVGGQDVTVYTVVVVAVLVDGEYTGELVVG
jgi:hypothetical protein